MIIKAILIFTLSLTLAHADPEVASAPQAYDGLGIGGGPPARPQNPDERPPIATDSLGVGGNYPILTLPNQGQVVTDGVLCRESATVWKPLRHNREELGRWPIEANAGCLEPLKEFSRKLSFARAPLALSFASFVDGLEKHLSTGALRWKSCTSGCAAKNAVPNSCIEATPLLQRTVQFPSGTEQFVLNKSLWDEVSSKQPLVCAATVVDLWLSTHVADHSKRSQMVNDFFSAKFHANSEARPECFDPTAATRPFEAFEGQIQNILLRIPSSLD